MFKNKPTSNNVNFTRSSNVLQGMSYINQHDHAKSLRITIKQKQFKHLLALIWTLICLRAIHAKPPFAP